jgi:hypothetical protein
MAQLRAEAQQTIQRAPDELYAIIADYTGRHRRIMPPAYHDYAVERGGSGEGSVVRWVLHVGNHRRPYEMQVDQAPQTHALTERDRHSSFTTQWLLSAEGTATHVRLVSTWEQRSHGFPALFERIFAPRSLARLHAETLRRLAAEAANPAA